MNGIRDYRSTLGTNDQNSHCERERRPEDQEYSNKYGKVYRSKSVFWSMPKASTFKIDPLTYHKRLSLFYGIGLDNLIGLDWIKFDGIELIKF